MPVSKPEIKKTLDEKRDEARNAIMQASWELFLEKGYEETTTRDIIRKTGILNGSLYNRFKSKEDILISIIRSAIEDCLKESEKHIDESDGPILTLCLPMAIEIYIASKSEKIAVLLYNAHQSWKATESYCEIYENWATKLIDSSYNIHLENEEVRMRIVSIIGAIGNICGMYANGFSKDYRYVFEYLGKFIGPMMEMRFYELSKLVDSLSEIIESSNIKICGKTLDEVLQSY